MKVVIKVGGTLLEESRDRRRLVEQVAPWFSAGHRILLVHGGGKRLTRFLEERGVRSHFRKGLRVTTAEALDGVVKVFAGTVNHELLADFYAASVPAVGISGIDAGCLVAEKLVGEQGEDWGFVGRIREVNPGVWEALLAAGFLPVLACLAVGKQGQIYNVNADQAAAACAHHWRADALVLLTDVDGVQDQQGHLLPRLAPEEIPALLASGAVTGGMLAKLHAVEEALAQEVSRVYIGNGRRDGVLEEIFSGKESHSGGTPRGTLIGASQFTGKEN